jgi:hypothetical protein
VGWLPVIVAIVVHLLSVSARGAMGIDISDTALAVKAHRTSSLDILHARVLDRSAARSQNPPG